MRTRVAKPLLPPISEREFMGQVIALAGLLPQLCVTTRDLVRAGRVADARQIQERITPLAKLVGTSHGVPGLKAALDLTGYVGGAPRPPLRPAPTAVIDALRVELNTLGITGPASAGHYLRQ